MRSSSRHLWTAYYKGASASKARVESPSFLPLTPFEGCVLGVDPSVRSTGLALVAFSKGQPSLIASQTVSFASSVSIFNCIGGVYKAIDQWLKLYTVCAVALESTVYVQNVQIAHKIGAVRGAAIAAAIQIEGAVCEYAPLRVKQAVTGNGRATKAQVAFMVSQHLKLSDLLPFDESDAAAIALCHGWGKK